MPMYGTLWEGRYRATVMNTETYLLTHMRHIVMNPVRAGMAVHPRDCVWSSDVSSSRMSCIVDWRAMRKP